MSNITDKDSDGAVEKSPAASVASQSSHKQKLATTMRKFEDYGRAAYTFILPLELIQKALVRDDPDFQKLLDAEPYPSNEINDRITQYVREAVTDVRPIWPTAFMCIAYVTGSKDPEENGLQWGVGLTSNTAQKFRKIPTRTQVRKIKEYIGFEEGPRWYEEFC